METVTISELCAEVPRRPGAYEVHAQVVRVMLRHTRGGKPYFELELADAGGSIKLKAWADGKAYPQVEALHGGEFVSVQGRWQHGDYGVDAQDWSLRPLETEEEQAVLAGPEEHRSRLARDEAYLRACTEALGDPRLRDLCARFFEKFGERFRRAAGARKNHHARRGGLVLHTAQMMRCADAIAGVYPHLNRDLLIAGVLFHDVGKLWENCYPESGFEMPYDFRAELMGHIPIGVEIANGLWREMMEGGGGKQFAGCEPPSDHVRLHLLHLILSHHGQLEFGSPVPPKTPEAMALHFVDNIDAKLEMFADGYGGAQLSPEVFERVWALGANPVRPLARHEPEPEPFDGLGDRLPD